MREATAAVEAVITVPANFHAMISLAQAAAQLCYGWDFQHMTAHDGAWTQSLFLWGKGYAVDLDRRSPLQSGY